MISKEVKRARFMSIVIVTLLCVALISMVFGYVQNGVAKRNRELAEEQTRIAEKNLEQALQLERQTERAEQQSKECENRNVILEQELIKLKNSRTN